jgi:hypothetical protein
MMREKELPMTQWRCTTSLCRAATNLIEVGVLVAVNIILYTVPDSVHLSTWKARE